jgi:mono/diheme cytochrome c family protein
MKHHLITTLFILLLANNVAAKAESPPATGTALEAESPQTKQPVSKVPAQTRGEMLYTNHCLNCHESIVHVREKRSAKNLDAIRDAVNRWSQELELKWSSREVEDVVLYLNLRYYHYSE